MHIVRLLGLSFLFVSGGAFFFIHTGCSAAVGKLTEIVEVENETWQGAKFGVC